jgi:hypothetical protein
MACNDKLSNNCGGTHMSAYCVEVLNIVLPKLSSLTSPKCLNAQETIKDIYEILKTIETSLDTTNLEKYCVSLETNDSGEITQREVNVGILEKICELETLLNNLGTPTVSEVSPLAIQLEECELDYKSLVDNCGEQITNLCQLLQTLIDKADLITALTARVAVLESAQSDTESTIADLVERITVLETA